MLNIHEPKWQTKTELDIGKAPGMSAPRWRPAAQMRIVFDESGKPILTPLPPDVRSIVVAYAAAVVLGSGPSWVGGFQRSGVQAGSPSRSHLNIMCCRTYVRP